MDKIFTNFEHFAEDIYVSDYTQFSTEHPEMAKRGVVISSEKPEQIGSLYISNPNAVKILAVNFEANAGAFKLPDGRKVPNCECMLVSEQGTPKRWLILAELKYCKGEDKNIASNVEAALFQLKETFLYLRDEKQLFGEKVFRYYWVISIPEHGEKVPFSAFILSQDKLIRYKDEYNAVIIGDNIVNVWTGSIIKLPVYR